MGAVWLAHRSDGRYEGRLRSSYSTSRCSARGGAERFAREGSMLARLTHPNIARLFDAGVDRARGQPYLVLEYIEGRADRSLLRQQSRCRSKNACAFSSTCWPPWRTRIPT